MEELGAIGGWVDGLDWVVLKMLIKIPDRDGGRIGDAPSLRV